MWRNCVPWKSKGGMLVNSDSVISLDQPVIDKARTLALSQLRIDPCG